MWEDLVSMVRHMGGLLLSLVGDRLVLYLRQLDRNLHLVRGTSMGVNPPFIFELLVGVHNRAVWRNILSRCQLWGHLQILKTWWRLLVEEQMRLL